MIISYFYFTQINNVIADATFLPLSVAYVWEYCQTQVSDWKLGGILFERDTVVNYLSQINSPDVFAISTYVWNWDISRELARAVKTKWPNCLIVMGGPQVPAKQQWLKENKIDYIPVDFRCCHFWDSGVHCLTVDIRRNGPIRDFFPDRTDDIYRFYTEE